MNLRVGDLAKWLRDSPQDAPILIRSVDSEGYVRHFFLTDACYERNDLAGKFFVHAVILSGEEDES